MTELNLDYMKWNDAIAKHFFNDGMAGREVILHADESVINEAGAGGIDNFIESIKKGPDWTAEKKEFCAKAYEAYNDWRSRKLEYPPYIAYLACCVLAVTQENEDKFAPQAYYARLHKLLGRSEVEFNQNNVGLLQDLWRDLEKWSSEDRKGAEGRFVVRRLGGWCNVGLFWSQAIISDAERKNLRGIFENARLDPTNPPPPEVLPRILLEFGKDVIGKRARDILKGTCETQKILQGTLVDLVLHDLEQWNGEVLQPLETAVSTEVQKEAQESKKIEKGSRFHPVYLRICIKVDKLNKSAVGYLRFKANVGFPENLEFTAAGTDRTWACEELHAGWSGKIAIDPFTLDWKSDFVLVDEKNLWKAELKGAATRLFASAESDNLPDYIERNGLQTEAQFYIACSEPDIEKVRAWGEKYCEEFRDLSIKNLPNGWRLFQIRNPQSSCKDIDVLTVPEKKRIRIEIRGIVVDRNTYLRISPPSVNIENATGSERIFLNGKQTFGVDASHTIKIKSDDYPNGVIVIEAIDGEQRDVETIYLTNPELPSSFDSTPHRDMFGEITGVLTSNQELPKVIGAVVSLTTHSNATTYPRLLPTALSHRIIFIGARPGEIADWPKEPFPSNWEPVWALCKKGKKWLINYCGDALHIEDHYKPAALNSDSRHLKRWREAIWFNRKISKRPAFRGLAKMWENYLEVAKHVGKH